MNLQQLQANANTLCREIESSLECCADNICTGGDVSDTFSKISQQLQQLSLLICDLQASQKHLPASDQTYWRNKASNLVSRYDTLNLQFRRRKEQHEQKQRRNQLFSGVETSGDIKILVDTAEEAHSLNSSLRMTSEYIESSRSSLMALVQQREWMTNIANKLTDMGALTKRGGKFIQSASQRLKHDFALTIVLIIGVLFLLWLVLKISR
ncbi:hypothetical protein GEMRC1_007793 [Eukaryota sp. GEM-RC1]